MVNHFEIQTLGCVHDSLEHLLVDLVRKFAIKISCFPGILKFEGTE